MQDILAYAKSHGRFSFRQMLKKKQGKTETVVSFLAILELMKMGKISLKQENAFGDLDITVNKEAEQEEMDLTLVEDFD